ncbi:MAG TPA: glucosaminidase domain-containing protein [Cyclobacteriaceae bacterium]|nr:glucosaminidase domain-containing protein [Cyclobacteriaceae bacterium]
MKLPRCLLGLCLLAGLISCERNPLYHVKTETVRVDSLDQIVSITKPIVRPIAYTHISGFEKLPVDEAKAKFISAVLPSILIARYDIVQNQKRIERLRDKINWNEEDSAFYARNKFHYRAKDIDDLMVRMKMLPVSIVLAQAAVESGWGKSRIFTKANNVFGVWSFNKHEPRIAALVKRGNRRIYLRSYRNLSQSITHYFEIIGRAKSFGKLREVLAETDDPLLIVSHLKNYSERRAAYTRQLESVMSKNNLLKYDRYILDPAYLTALE